MNTENTTELVSYEFKTKKGSIEIAFEDVIENPKFRIQGPKEIVHKAIGGLGNENSDDTITIVTEKELDTEAKRMFAVLEVLKTAKEG